MSVSKGGSSRSSERAKIGSDLARVDAHVIRPEEYDELPEVTEGWLAEAIVCENGKPLHRLRGRPSIANPKKQVTVRLDADVLAGIRATGPGWHGRINAALRDWLHRREQD